VAVLDLGCGAHKEPGAIGVDRSSETQADVVHDLDRFPYPFPDSSFDRIIGRDVLEHLTDVLAVMSELARIGRPGALIELRTPHFSSCLAYADPTHRHVFALQSVDHLAGVIPTPGYGARFEIVSRRLVFWRLHRLLGVSWLANRAPLVYEKLFAFWFPAMNVEAVLRVVK
jgi:SAM-dependent methyltransferase